MANGPGNEVGRDWARNKLTAGWTSLAWNLPESDKKCGFVALWLKYMIRQGRLGNDNLVCNYFWSGRVDNIVRGGKVYLQRLGNGRRWRVLRQWCIMGCITMFALLIASVVKFFGIICSWKKKGKRDVTVKSDILWRCCIAIFQWNVAILIDELAWGIQVPEFMWYAFKSIVIQLRMRNIHKTFHVRESMAHWSFRFTLVVTLQTWLWRHTHTSIYPRWRIMADNRIVFCRN